MTIARTPEQVDEMIVRRVLAGTAPGNIASGLGWRVADIYARLDALGVPYEIAGHEAIYKVHRMWTMEPRDLRQAIWQRQHDGAVATLEGKL